MADRRRGRPAPQAADYKATGLSVATGASDVDLICVPDHVHPTLSTDEQHALTDAIVETCDRTADRFALLATPGNEHDPERLKPTHDTEAAATYYPWLRTPSSEGFIPPIGHVAGALRERPDDGRPCRADWTLARGNRS